MLYSRKSCIFSSIISKTQSCNIIIR